MASTLTMTVSQRAISELTSYLPGVKISSPASEIGVQIKLFLVDRRARNRSPRTIEYYQNTLSHFAWWCEREGITSLTTITGDVVRRHTAYLQQSPHRWESAHPRAGRAPLSPASVHTYLRAVKAFLRFCLQEGDIERDPFATVRLPKVPKKVVPTFSDSQLGAILEQTGTGHPNGLRDQAILWLLLDTGVRASELVNLRLTDLRDGRLKVQGKGDKERYAPLGNKALRAIVKYVAKERPEGDSDRIFLTRTGEPFGIRRLHRIVAVLCQRAQVTGVRASPHTFRHTNAVKRVRAGWDLRTLQHALGHESLITTTKYLTCIGDEDVARSHTLKGIGDDLKAKVR